MTFKPQPVARAREQVESQIREAILSGTFKRGEKQHDAAINSRNGKRIDPGTSTNLEHTP
jgi:GntR family transcriptional regulator, transcriptional repressor for pyruvate dehydrogenase complex